MKFEFKDHNGDIIKGDSEKGDRVIQWNNEKYIARRSEKHKHQYIVYMGEAKIYSPGKYLDKVFLNIMKSLREDHA